MLGQGGGNTAKGKHQWAESQGEEKGGKGATLFEAFKTPNGDFFCQGAPSSKNVCSVEAKRGLATATCYSRASRF